MEEGLCTAGWRVSYPDVFSADATWNLLQSMLLVNWSWELFIWDLRELFRLMTTTPAEFNYLFLTAFLKARAAYLAATGPFDCMQQAILIGLGSKRVQFAAIYYRLLLAMLQDVLRSETGAKLIGDREDRMFQLAIGEMERRYIEILEVIALEPDMGEEIHGLDIESWLTGTVLRAGKRECVIPAAVQVPVFMQRYGRHLLVRPCARDLVRKIKKREAFRSFMQRAGVVTRTDIEIEKLSRFSKVGGYGVVKYGDLEVQYYVTLTNTAKRTLYVVCADRTMRIDQRNGVPPGCRPTIIEVAEKTRGGEELYVVTFDSGAVGIFAIDFRPHKENEHEHVPEGVWRLPSFSACGRGPCAHAHAPAAQVESHACVIAPSAPALGDEYGDGSPFGGAAAAEVKADGGVKDLRVEIDREYMWIKVNGQEIDFSRKRKRREFVRFLHERKERTGEAGFRYCDMTIDFAKQTGRAIESERFEEDLFKGQSREFHLLFEVVDKKKDLYRLKI